MALMEALVTPNANIAGSYVSAAAGRCLMKQTFEPPLGMPIGHRD
jgi:hypothetical protein